SQPRCQSADEVLCDSRRVLRTNAPAGGTSLMYGADVSESSEPPHASIKPAGEDMNQSW
ncbi:MAG: hypothetical protein IH624_08570, partial [Phycisphaerae bacterium]|nr:hypothetical protein [Phycisphaerae bacterium]